MALVLWVSRESHLQKKGFPQMRHFVGSIVVWGGGIPFGWLVGGPRIYDVFC